MPLLYQASFTRFRLGTKPLHYHDIPFKEWIQSILKDMSCKLNKTLSLPKSNIPSASQQTPFPQDLSDQIMMEAPDSPSEPSQISSANQSFFQAHSGSQQQPTTTSRLNGDAKASHGAPGSSWASKKFHDEYDRTYSSLLDQQWDSSKFFLALDEGCWVDGSGSEIWGPSYEVTEVGIREWL
jgi:hypothetical protein